MDEDRTLGYEVVGESLAGRVRAEHSEAHEFARLQTTQIRDAVVAVPVASRAIFLVGCRWSVVSPRLRHEAVADTRGPTLVPRHPCRRRHERALRVGGVDGDRCVD